MTVSLKTGSLEKPGEAGVTKVEIRDTYGKLLVMCIELPGGAVLVSRVGDSDFEWNANNHHIPMIQQAGPLMEPGRIILG